MGGLKSISAILRQFFNDISKLGAAFVAGAPIEMVDAERDGYRFRYGAYRVGEHLVWGATAGILGRLGAFLGSASR